MGKPVVIYGGGAQVACHFDHIRVSVNHHCPLTPDWVCFLDDPSIEGQPEFREYVNKHEGKLVSGQYFDFSNHQVRDSAMFAFWFVSEHCDSKIYINGVNFYEGYSKVNEWVEVQKARQEVFKQNIKLVNNKVEFLTGPLKGKYNDHS